MDADAWKKLTAPAANNAFDIITIACQTESIIEI